MGMMGYMKSRLTVIVLVLLTVLVGCNSPALPQPRAVPHEIPGSFVTHTDEDGLYSMSTPQWWDVGAYSLEVDIDKSTSTDDGLAHLICEGAHYYQDEISKVHKQAIITISVGHAGNRTIHDIHDEAWATYRYDETEVKKIEHSEPFVDGEPAIMSQWETRGTWSSHYITVDVVIDEYYWYIWCGMDVEY